MRMKIFLKYLLLGMIVTVFAVLFAISSSAASETVLYISSDGTGDGSSPDKPLGNFDGYIPDDRLLCHKNVMARALYELQNTGGTIVLVGPTYLDTASDNTGGANMDPSDLNVLLNTGVTGDHYIEPYDRPTIYITSVYGGIDYRRLENGGAKLVLDHSRCCTGNLRMRNPSVWKDLIIEYRYDLDYLNSYNNTDKGIVAPYMIECDFFKTVFDSGITCTSVRVEKTEESIKEYVGNVYPMIIGGHRQNTKDKNYNTDVTIKSGTWSYVSAAGYGHSISNNASVKGNAKLKVIGGKIGTIYGTGSVTRPYGTVWGSVEIIVTGGEIGNVWLTNGEVYFGPKITMTVSNTKITGVIYHSPNDGEIVPECKVTVDGQLYMPPTTEPPETKPQTTVTQTPVPATTAKEVTDIPVSDTTDRSPDTTKQTSIFEETDTIVPIIQVTDKPTDTIIETAEDHNESYDNSLMIVIIIIALASIVVSVVLLILTVLIKKGRIKLK